MFYLLYELYPHMILYAIFCNDSVFYYDSNATICEHSTFS